MQIGISTYSMITKGISMVGAEVEIFLIVSSRLPPNASKLYYFVKFKHSQVLQIKDITPNLTKTRII